jgi:hypothetical protein
MTFFPRRTPALLLALPAMLALPACAGGPSTVTIPVALDCAGRIPPQLRADAAPAAPPADNSVGEWVAFGEAQTGRLETANDRKATMLWILEACEAEERAAAARLLPRPPWWRRLTGGAGR